MNRHVHAMRMCIESVSLQCIISGVRIPIVARKIHQARSRTRSINRIFLHVFKDSQPCSLCMFEFFGIALGVKCSRFVSCTETSLLSIVFKMPFPQAFLYTFSFAHVAVLYPQQ